MALFGLLLGLAIGTVMALLVEFLRPAIRRQEDLAATLGAASPVVIPRTMLPRAPRHGRNGKSALVATADPNSGGAEAYRSLRTALLFSPAAAGVRSLLVTSAVPGEGKTTVASNLSAVFAQQGVRVLLIDADLRRARLHSVFHVQRAPGLTSLVEGAVLPEQAVHATDVPNLSFLPSGAPPSNPSEVLGSKAMAVTLRFLSGQYDLIILDSPPLLSAADASILATLVDGVIMVVRAGRLNEDVVRMAQQQVENVGGRVVAAVLNDPDAEVKRYGGDCYFTGYSASQKSGEKADARAASRTRVPRAAQRAVQQSRPLRSGEFLGQCHDDARGAPHVAEPVHVLVLRHLADQLGTVGPEASHGVVHASTANMMLRRPSVFGGAIAGSIATSAGLWNFVSSTRPCPSGVRIMMMSTWTPSSPLIRSTQGPSIGISPSSAMPRVVKKAMAAGRSSTTTLTWSILLIVMFRV